VGGFITGLLVLTAGGHGHSSTLKSQDPLGSSQKWGFFDITGCGESTCSSCLAKSQCVWCPSEPGCHLYGFSTCILPIDSEGQCWSQGYPFQIGDFLADRPDDTKQWLEQTLKHYKDPLQPFPEYPAGQTGIFDLTSGVQLDSASSGNPAVGVKIVAVSDWGTGTGAAAAVGQLMSKQNGDLTFHLGDVYYVGTEEQYAVIMAGRAPQGQGQVQGVSFPKGGHTTFLMTGNHEMISGGSGLFKVGFTYSGQAATYGVWQSDSWRFVALDSGYECYMRTESGARVFSPEQQNLAQSNAPQPEQVVEWLMNVVKLGDPNDKRGIVLFTHHQPLSDWNSPIYQGTAQQLNKILPRGKQVVMFFGHEHRLAFYDFVVLAGMDFAILPRMIGNGGFPDKTMSPTLGTGHLVGFDQRLYQSIPQPPLSPFQASYNGFFTIAVDGPALKVEYITGKCAASGCESGYDEEEGTVVAAETVTVDLSTGSLTQEWTSFGNAAPDSLTWLQRPAGKNTYTGREQPVYQKDMSPGSLAGGICAISHGSNC